MQRLPLIAALALLIPLVGFAGGQNLLVNGDFSAGTAGFTSQYNYIPNDQGIFTNPGEWSVISNPSLSFTNGYANYGDHTTGDGLMLFADGGSPNLNVWSENVSLSSPGAYTFSGWVANADIPLANPAVLALYLNGTEVGQTFTITQTGGIWDEWTVHFDVDTPGNDSIAIRDLNPDLPDGGNDFTLDDLSLTKSGNTTTPEPSTFLLLGSALSIVPYFRKKLL